MKESERTKHVHRLHPYKGKFIPQLVEYFLDSHTDYFKKEVFFKRGDTILDPFVGSGTTLVQCLELGLNSIGIDISKFNCMISEAKTRRCDIGKLKSELYRALRLTRKFGEGRFDNILEENIGNLINSFNKIYYPSPEYKILISKIYGCQNRIENKIKRLLKTKENTETEQDVIDSVLDRYKDEIESLEEEITGFLSRKSIKIEFKLELPSESSFINKFTSRYSEVTLGTLQDEIKKEVSKHEGIQQISRDSLHSKELIDKPFINSPFLSSWFTDRQRSELKYYLKQIQEQDDARIKEVMMIVLSRTARSCRATKHVDLATLVEPQYETYYCRKHFKICRPVYTIVPHLSRYTKDGIRRIRVFSELRKDVYCKVINADSRTVNIFEVIAEKNRDFYNLLREKKIDGIFTSPPYVGQIDYHEQHAYAYELFDIERKDELEIGRMSNGKSKKAQKDYVDGISEVLLNVKKFLKEDANIFIVANDSKNLYPTIAKKSGLKIINTYRRPVLNRTERDKQPYSESIFHMRFEG